MPNSCNTICTRQQRDELLLCFYGNTLYAENTMLWPEKWWFVRFHFESLFSDSGSEGRRKERKLIVKRGEKEKRLRCSEKKVRGRKRETRRGFLLAVICSCALDNLGHFCHCISIRWAETPHLPFISFPFQHLQVICILSVLPLSFIFPHATTFPEW